MNFLIGLPLLTVLVILQTSVVSRIGISNGSMDLVMICLVSYGLMKGARNTILWFTIAGLLLALISAVPLLYPVIPYVIIAFLLDYLRQRIWSNSLLLMLVLMFAGTLILHTFTFISVSISMHALPLMQSFTQVTLPSLAMNILFGLPLFLIIQDWYTYLQPIEEA